MPKLVFLKYFLKESHIDIEKNAVIFYSSLNPVLENTISADSLLYNGFF